MTYPTVYPSVYPPNAFPAAFPGNAFISQWKTDNAGGVSNNDQIQLPLIGTGTYDFNVDWGDGTNDDISSDLDPEITHTYAGGAGTYTVTITGDIEGFRFNNAKDKTKIISIDSWGSLKLGSTAGAFFYGCENLVIPATDTLDMTGTTDLTSAWRGCTSLTTVPSFLTLDTSLVTSLDNTFRGCTNFDQPLTNLNTSNVTSLRAFLRDCSVWNHPVNQLDVSSVTNFSRTFHGANAFNQPVNLWDTSSSSNMGNMFRNATSFNQSVSNFDTSQTTTFISMFNGCTAFDQDVHDFNIASLNDATDMMTGSGFSITNYDLLLGVGGWAFQAGINNNVQFSGGTAQYSAGNPATAKAMLINVNLWTITDGGQV
jgi:surface protein